MFRWIRADEQVIQTRHLEMLERELQYYREKFDGERKRGDRINDELLQRTGSLPVSDLGREQLSESEEKAKETMKIMQSQLAEIYGDGGEEEIPLDEETAKTV